MAVCLKRRKPKPKKLRFNLKRERDEYIRLFDSNSVCVYLKIRWCMRRDDGFICKHV